MRKRLNVSRLAGAELERILARTMLALLTLLDFPAIVYCDDSEENMLVSRELFEAQTELHLALWLQATAGAPPGAG